MRVEVLNDARQLVRPPARSFWSYWAGAALFLALNLPAPAQTSDEVRQILERIDRLEQQNRELTAEVHALREELASARGAPAQEGTTGRRLEVDETRIAEQAQAKVEASQHFPIRITGMVLFNSFLDSSGSGGVEYPVLAAPGHQGAGGASLRQTVIGLDYDGPRTLWNGKVEGSLRMDLFGGSGEPLYQSLRLRTGTIRIDWKDRSIMAGVDKPLISPRDPSSLAQVGVSPLTAAGNLWLWIPQVRFEQDFRFSENSGMQAQAGIVQTHETAGTTYGNVPPSSVYVEPARPGVEARVEFFGGTDRRIEIASGFHHSVSHVADASVPSDIYSVDWFARPWRQIEFTGSAFVGHNVAPLGSLRQGFVVAGPGVAYAVHSRGGWGQLTYRPGSRLWFNLFSGEQNDDASDLPRGSIGRNLVYGANIFYRLAPNVLASLEASQTRTNYLGNGTLLNNHYDLALAYLF